MGKDGFVLKQKRLQMVGENQVIEKLKLNEIERLGKMTTPDNQGNQGNQEIQTPRQKQSCITSITSGCGESLFVFLIPSVLIFAIFVYLDAESKKISFWQSALGFANIPLAILKFAAIIFVVYLLVQGWKSVIGKNKE